jgi:hypothetical protein
VPTEVELQRRTAAGGLAPWEIADDAQSPTARSEPVLEPVLRQRIDIAISVLRDVLVAVRRGSPDQDRRMDWQAVGGENKPHYIGVAPPGSATNAAVWAIERYTFAAGPATGNVPVLIETRVGAWDNRANLF